MAAKKTDSALAKELTELLSPACPGIQVDVGISDRWKRMCLTFRWPGFADLLPEERFRLLARRIPVEFLDKNCPNAVWLELTPSESIDDFLALPRSEDIADRAPAILKTLVDANFFALLEDELVRVPPARHPDDFTYCKRVLAAGNAKPEQTREACLAFMHHKAYNDWEVLREVRPIAESAAKRGASKAQKQAKPGKIKR